MRYRINPGRVTELRIIDHEDICSNAVFQLDRQLLLQEDTVLILEDGQWFIETDDEPIRIQGRWRDARAKNSSQNIKAPRKPRICDS